MSDFQTTSPPPESQLSPGPVHLNGSGCIIRLAEGKGRGVYASRRIPRDTVVKISPVLFFSKEEYENHGKHTVLDHYTFNWADGRMALALGLGSLFNHSDTPNVTFKLDRFTESIRYTTVHDVDVGEELCIFHGHKLWFSPVEDNTIAEPSMNPNEVENGWEGLSAVEDGGAVVNEQYLDGNPGEIIPDEELPFTRYKLSPEEEEPGSIRTVNAWVVDIHDPRHITKMLQWLKKSGLETPDLGHLKRIRKQDGVTTLLLSTSPEPPQLPEDLNLPEPIQIPVPSSPALTMPSLSIKSALWPTMYTPRRKGESETWSRGKVRWALEAMRFTVEAAIKAQRDGELPIAAHIPTPYEISDQDSSYSAYTACDTRKSASHPLRHAAINVIRRIADHRASADPVRFPSPDDSTDPISSPAPGNEDSHNGSNYLLTSLTLFITHEPCIMCSMALLHSRVKEVIYLYPMAETGGCGGVACLPTLRGVNHRFGICRWDEEKARISYYSLNIDSGIDA